MMRNLIFDLEVDLYTSKYGMLIRENTAQKTQTKLILSNNVGSCTRVFVLILTDKNLPQRYGNLKCNDSFFLFASLKRSVFTFCRDSLSTTACVIS